MIRHATGGVNGVRARACQAKNRSIVEGWLEVATPPILRFFGGGGGGRGGREEDHQHTRQDARQKRSSSCMLVGIGYDPSTLPPSAPCAPLTRSHCVELMGDASMLRRNVSPLTSSQCPSCSGCARAACSSTSPLAWCLNHMETTASRLVGKAVCITMRVGQATHPGTQSSPPPPESSALTLGMGFCRM